MERIVIIMRLVTNDQQGMYTLIPKYWYNTGILLIESHNSWPRSTKVGVFPLHDSKIKIRALILEYIERLTCNESAYTHTIVFVLCTLIMMTFTDHW